MEGNHQRVLFSNKVQPIKYVRENKEDSFKTKLAMTENSKKQARHISLNYSYKLKIHT